MTLYDAPLLLEEGPLLEFEDACLIVCVCFIACIASYIAQRCYVSPVDNGRYVNNEPKRGATKQVYRQYLEHQIDMYLGDNEDEALSRLLNTLLCALRDETNGVQRKEKSTIASLVAYRLLKAVESPTPTYPREVWLSLTSILQAVAAIETPQEMRCTMIQLHDTYEDVKEVWLSPAVLPQLRAALGDDIVPREWRSLKPPHWVRMHYLENFDLLLVPQDADDAQANKEIN